MPTDWPPQVAKSPFWPILTFVTENSQQDQNHPKMVRNGKLSLKIRVLPLPDKAGKAKFGFSNRKKSQIGPFPIVREPGFWGLKLTFGPLTGHYRTFHLSWPYFDPNSVLCKTETECPITPVWLESPKPGIWQCNNQTFDAQISFARVKTRTAINSG